MDLQIIKGGAERVRPMLVKYRYPLIVLIAGLFLLAISGGTSKASSQTQASVQVEQSQEFSLTEFQNTLCQTLSLVNGIGRVEVMLSLESSSERVYAEDVRETESAYESAIATVSDGSYGQTPVERFLVSPNFRGAVVVCDGGDREEDRKSVV